MDIYKFLIGFGMSHDDAMAWQKAGRIPPRSVYLTRPGLANVVPKQVRS